MLVVDLCEWIVCLLRVGHFTCFIFPAFIFQGRFFSFIARFEMRAWHGLFACSENPSSNPS